MLRGLRVPMLPATATTRPPRRRLLRAAAAIFRHVVDFVLYGFLAVCWAHSLGGIAVEILGRRVYGKGCAAEGVGAAVRAACWIVLVRLFPFVAPLFVMRFIERVKFEEKREERREKPAGNGRIPDRNKEQILLAEGFNVASLLMSAPLCQLWQLAIMMKHGGEGSRMWSMGSVLYDVACFSLAVNIYRLFIAKHRNCGHNPQGAGEE